MSSLGWRQKFCMARNLPALRPTAPFQTSPRKNHHIIHHSPRSCTSSFPSWRRLINLTSSSTHLAARNFSFQNLLKEKVRGVTWKRKVCGFPSCEIAYLRGRPSLQLPGFPLRERMVIGSSWTVLVAQTKLSTRDCFLSLFLLPLLFQKNATKTQGFEFLIQFFQFNNGRNHNFLNQKHTPQVARSMTLWQYSRAHPRLKANTSGVINLQHWCMLSKGKVGLRSWSWNYIYTYKTIYCF